MRCFVCEVIRNFFYVLIEYLLSHSPPNYLLSNTGY